MSWRSARPIPTIQLRVGAGLDSLRTELPHLSLDRRPDLDQVVVDRPVTLRYSEEDGISVDLPPGRFLELRGTLGTIHTVVVAPQLECLEQDGAIELVEGLSSQAEGRGWEVRHRFWKPDSLREQLASESGYFQTRYVATAKGQESLTFSLTRVEQSGLLRRRKGGHGYLVNLAWNNAVLEGQLREQLRAKRGQGRGAVPLKPEPMPVGSAAAATLAH